MQSAKNVSTPKTILYPQFEYKPKNQKVKLEYKPDSFEKTTNTKKDNTNNGKFDLSECLKNFNNGLISPLTAAIKHPLMTLGVVAGTAALCTLIPVMTPIMGIAFGALSVFQLGKGVYDVAKNFKNKEYDKAEKSFNGLGQGTIGVVLSAFGLKQGAKVAKEAKLMGKLGTNSLTVEQKAQIAKEIKEASKLDALKEIGSLFTSKAGWKAVGAQFKPSNIATRAKDAFKFLFKKEKATKIKKEKMPFEKTTEGKRRAAMSSEEIKTEVNTLYKEACDELGIPEELRPEVKLYKNERHPEIAGGYNPDEHTITINESSYKKGYFDLPDVIKHEITHADEAILRQRLPMEEKEKIAIEYLLDKIQNGDKQNIVTGEKNFIDGAIKVKPPQMSSKMKAEFSKLAIEKLYKSINYSNDDMVSIIKPLVENNPDFVQGYNSVDDAVNAMVNYAKTHNYRYKIAMNNASGFNTSKIDPSLLKELSQEEKIAAIKSFKEGIDCIEGNVARQGGVLGLGADFDQYQFTPEEVLAQQRGNNFEITKLEGQLKKLRAQTNYDLAEEAKLLDRIKRCKLIIEYKTKGQEMYSLKMQSFNNPENTELAAKIEAMQSELYNIHEQIQSIGGGLTSHEVNELSLSGKTPGEILEIAKNNPTNEYSTYQVLQRPPMGTSIGIPYTVTNSVDIMADNFQKDE